MDKTSPAYRGSDSSIPHYYPLRHQIGGAYKPVKWEKYVINNMILTAITISYFPDPVAPYKP